MKFLMLFTSLLTLTLSQTSMAKSNVVYGDDNRMEAYEAPAEIQDLGNSTAAMVPSNKLIPILDSYMLPPSTLRQDMNLCEGERFENQLSAALCSGFLVGPDLLVTAGHCVTTQYDCDKYTWIFDYKVNPNGKEKRTNIIAKASNVYKCKRVVEAKLEMSKTGKIDYSLIQLERVVEDRKPLKYRSEGKIEDSSDIYVIGYPSGLPQKYSPDAQLVSNTDTHFFKANLDTFGGNSGSSVFNSRTNVVEGILVRGARDYDTDPLKKCRTVHTTTQGVTDLSKYGESVTRITDIPSLKYRDSLMLAAQTGDMPIIQELVAQKVDLQIADNNNKTALDHAKAAGHVELVKYITEEITKAASAK